MSIIILIKPYQIQLCSKFIPLVPDNRRQNDFKWNHPIIIFHIKNRASLIQTQLVENRIRTAQGFVM
jgi:hypothetical protein